MLHPAYIQAVHPQWSAVFVAGTQPDGTRRSSAHGGERPLFATLSLAVAYVAQYRLRPVEAP